ncbi:MAG: IS1595 family transposase [Candidatus Acidiferrales bacterium]
MKTPRTLQEAIQFFGDFETCRQFMVSVRWSDGKVRCPYCGAEKVTYLEKARLYRCYGDHPKQKFSLKVGTIFEDSPIPLEKWLPAVWMLVNCRNAVSSYEIHRALGITQKSAWFMLHRIRLAMQTGSFAKLGGNGGAVESDETFVGGRLKNMHPARQKKMRELRDNYIGPVQALNKATVMGFLDREQRKIRTTVIPKANRDALMNEILNNIAPGSKIYTDEARFYRAISKEYIHDFVNHAEKYVKGEVHTNGLENFWSLLKRGLNGTYVAVEPFHLFRYLDEQAFRFNNRRDASGRLLNDAERFEQAVSQIVGKRLTFAEVTGKEGGSAAN